MYYIIFIILVLILIINKYNYEFFNINIKKRGMVKYTYNDFFDEDLSFFNINKPINVNHTDNISPDQNVKNISYKYITEYVPTKTGNYSFRLQSKNASYLYVNDLLVVDNGGIHSLQEKTGNIYLFAGEIYKIKVYYGNNIGKSFLKFLWKKPSDYFYSEDLSSFIPPIVKYK